MARFSEEATCEEVEVSEPISCDEHGVSPASEDDYDNEGPPVMQEESEDEAPKKHPIGCSCWDCNPDSSESESEDGDFLTLYPMAARERKFRMNNGITMDTGAGDNVIPRRMINEENIEESPGQKRGLHYVSCTNHRIPNEGQIKLKFDTVEGHKQNWTFQIADVNKPLGCVADRVDDRCRVVFDRDDDTGEDISHVYDKRTKTMMRMRRTGKTWRLDAMLTADMIANSSPVFSRRG